MRYQHVCIESLGYTLPDEIVTSDEIEARLSPLYERLRLPQGRLELITGIRERRICARRTGSAMRESRSASRRRSV